VLDRVLGLFGLRFVGVQHRGEPVPLETSASNKTFLSFFNLNNLDLHPIRTKAEQLDNYVGWVYACINKIGGDVRTNPRGVYERRGPDPKNWIQVPSDQLPAIFTRPNTRQTWGQLLETRTQHKDATGEAYWHALSPTPGGTLVGCEMIQPDWVKEPVFEKTGTVITHWKVEVPGANGGIKDYPAEDVFPDFYTNPRSPTRGASPIEAFGLAHHLDIYLRAYGVKTIKDGSAVSQFLKTEMELTNDEVDAAENRLNEKFRTPGRTPVFGKGTELKNVGLPFRDLNMLQMLRPSREMILAIYGMPPSKLGIMEGEGRANAGTADKTYQENTVLPRLLTGDEIINTYLMPRIYGRRSSKLVYMSESPVEADREWELKKVTTMFHEGVINFNEYRQSQGYAGIGTKGEVYFIPLGCRVVKSPEDAIVVELPETNPENEDGGGNDNMLPLAEEKAVLALEGMFRSIATAKQLTVGIGEKRASKNEEENTALRFEAAEDKLERELISKVRSLFSKEQKIVVEAMKKNVRDLPAFAAHWREEMTRTQHRKLEFSFDYIAEIPLIAERRDWLDDAMRDTNEQWNRILKEAIQGSLRVGWNLLANEVVGALSFSLYQIQAAEYAQRRAGNQVVNIRTTTVDEIRDVITTGIVKGASIEEITRKVAELYDGFRGYRAERIARTEVANAMNHGKYEAAKQSAQRLGMDIRRTWITTLDERTRNSHASAHDQTVGINEMFTVGGVPMRYPGDNNAPAREVVNCRCTQIFFDVAFV